MFPLEQTLNMPHAFSKIHQRSMTYLLGGFSMAPRFWTFWWLARSYNAELQAGWLMVIWHGKENHKDSWVLKEQLFNLGFKSNFQLAVG